MVKKKRRKFVNVVCERPLKKIIWAWQPVSTNWTIYKNALKCAFFGTVGLSQLIPISKNSRLSIMLRLTWQHFKKSLILSEKQNKIILFVFLGCTGIFGLFLVFSFPIWFDLMKKKNFFKWDGLKDRAFFLHAPKFKLIKDV